MNNGIVKNIETDSEDWGYVFKGSAIDSLIRNLEGEAALESYPEFRERRERANELIYECVGHEPCLFYVRRKGAGREPGEEIWELTIATDRDDFQLPARLEKLGKTLGLRAAVAQNGSGGLKLLSAKLVQGLQGHADSYTLPCRLRLLPNHRHRIDIPPAALARMATMPVCGDHVPTEDQLQAWKTFLQIEENIAKARQFCVPYVSHNYRGTRQIAFDIDVAKATLDGSTENSLEGENFWERVKRARNEEVKHFETAPTGRNRRNSRQLGSIEEVDHNRCMISVRLERDLADYMATGRYHLPATGFLFFEATGDIKQIQRKKKALDDLNNGRTQNPFLGNFLFDASQARPIQKTVQLQPEDLLLSSANPSQKAAVETVLAAEDLVLIQGPPGTGKTTVIAEICYQVALRGGRTLIASQANLAVDNALSRLVHNPAIRAVRKGRAERVGEEGQPFLEDRVIGTWLKNTANDCENSLAKRLDNVQVFRQLLASSQRFTAYLTAEEAFKREQNLLQERRATLDSACTEQKKEYHQAVAQLGKVESLKAALQELVKKAPSVDWQEPAVVNLLAGLVPYTSTDSSVRNFTANVRLAIDLASELDMVHPNHGLFGLAGWLQDTVASWIIEVRKALSYANDTAIAMTEADSAAQTYRQNSDSVVSLKSNHQQLLANQQTLQQRISNLKNRKSEVSLAMSELEKWLLTAHTSVVNTLTRCLEERQDFTCNLISLPSGLLTLTMETQCFPWQKSLEQCEFKVQELTQKYRQWDRVSSLASELNRLLVRGRNLLGTRYKSEADVSKVTLKGGLEPIQSLRELKQLAQRSIDKIEQPLGFWGWILQWVLAVVEKHSLESIAKKLRPYSRRYSTTVTLETIRRQARATIQKVQPGDSKSALSEIAAEAISSIVTSARTWLNQLQVKTEQELIRLGEQLNEQWSLAANLQKQIPFIQEQLETSRSEADFKFKRAIAKMQELSQFPNLPNKLRVLVKQYLDNPSNILAEIPHVSAKLRECESRTKQLETLIYSIEPFAVLSTIKDLLIIRISSLQNTTESYKRQVTESQNKLSQIDSQLQQQSDYIKNERTWWISVWEAIPDRLKPIVPADSLSSPEFLRNVKTQFDFWQQQLKNEETYLKRYQHFVEDWIDKLRNPSEGDRNDLRRIYLDNANVIGITCVQAASRDFSEEFKYFDVVIIDEVSKCTPPELLIPALKGKKLVMVGDHRQLPPMLDTSTLEEVVQEIGSTREELPFLEESLFKSQFETADESIKCMLTTQYRMHPIIMGAINQFYDSKLECGILQPDIKRAHNLKGEIIQEHHHLMWAEMPLGNEFQEQRDRTSFFNIREVEAIKRLCKQIDNAWASRVANGEPKKEIAVITFYGAQLRQIDERIQSELFPSLQIRTGTVDRFQGMERPVVIVSMVRNNTKGDVGFAKKPERVNVAFSRAQELLIIVGCHSLFTNQRGNVGSMYSNISNIVNLHKGFIDVSRLFC